MDTISPKEKKMIEELHSGKYLAFAILLLAAAGIRIISVITMFSIEDYLVGSNLGMLAIDWIVFIIPFVIMGIGMLLAYIKAGKGIFEEGYLKLIKRAVAVKGVRTSIHMILIALFGLSCCLPSVLYLSEVGYKELETTAMLVCIAMIVISSYAAFISLKYIQGFNSMIEDTPGVFCIIKRKRMFIPWIISAIIFNVLMIVVLKFIAYHRNGQ